MTAATTIPAIPSVEARSLVENNYLEYGKYVNATRSTLGPDGLKSVQRRVLLALRDVDNGKKVPSVDVVARTMAAYHPHGDASIYDTLCRMVQRGFVVGLSNFGAQLLDEVGAAAYRYTYCKPHKEFADGAFKFVDLVPQVENEYAKMEPKFLPVPIPLGLTTGAKGIGIGLLSGYPAFSPSSLFDALMKDDPSLLKAPNGLFIVSGSTDKVWKTGEGWLQYGLKCYTEWRDLDGKQVSVIEGPGKLFRPRIWETFEQLLNEESVYIRDESAKNIKAVISRVKGLKRISDEEVHKRAQSAAVQQMFFRIYIAEDGVARRRSMRDWMQDLWGRYQTVVDTYKKNQVDSLNHRIKIYNLIPTVGPHVLADKTPDEIAKILTVPVEDVKEVETKSIRMLRKADFGSEIKSLNDQIAKINKIDSKSLAKDFVNVLEKAQA